MKKTLYLCGAGNPEGVRLAIRINEKERRWERLVILDDDPRKRGSSILGLEIAGPFDTLGQADPNAAEVVNLVARTTMKRRAAYLKIDQFGIPFASLIDPGVDTWGVEWRGDVTVYQQVIFSAGAVLDQGSVVFAGAVLGHRCTVGKWCVIAPGAVLNARVELEDGAYVGTNASILPDLKIGAWATVGVNTGVVESIPAGATALGVPAQIMVPQSAATAGAVREETSSAESLGNVETRILEVWRKVLNLETVGPDDNFFQLGGNSLLAVQLHAQLQEHMDSGLTVVDIFRFPSIRMLAAAVAKPAAPAPSPGVGPGPGRDMFSKRRLAKTKFKDL